MVRWILDSSLLESQSGTSLTLQGLHVAKVRLVTVVEFSNSAKECLITQVVKLWGGENQTISNSWQFLFLFRAVKGLMANSIVLCMSMQK